MLVVGISLHLSSRGWLYSWLNMCVSALCLVSLRFAVRLDATLKRCGSDNVYVCRRRWGSAPPLCAATHVPAPAAPRSFSVTTLKAEEVCPHMLYSMNTVSGRCPSHLGALVPLCRTPRFYDVTQYHHGIANFSKFDIVST